LYALIAKLFSNLLARDKIKINKIKLEKKLKMGDVFKVDVKKHTLTPYL
jgi:hypothetical protein